MSSSASAISHPQGLPVTSLATRGSGANVNFSALSRGSGPQTPPASQMTPGQACTLLAHHLLPQQAKWTNDEYRTKIEGLAKTIFTSFNAEKLRTPTPTGSPNSRLAAKSERQKDVKGSSVIRGALDTLKAIDGLEKEAISIQNSLSKMTAIILDDSSRNKLKEHQEKLKEIETKLTEISRNIDLLFMACDGAVKDVDMLINSLATRSFFNFLTDYATPTKSDLDKVDEQLHLKKTKCKELIKDCSKLSEKIDDALLLPSEKQQRVNERAEVENLSTTIKAFNTSLAADIASIRLLDAPLDGKKVKDLEDRKEDLKALKKSINTRMSAIESLQKQCENVLEREIKGSELAQKAEQGNSDLDASYGSHKKELKKVNDLIEPIERKLASPFSLLVIREKIAELSKQHLSESVLKGSKKAAKVVSAYLTKDMVIGAAAMIALSYFRG